MGVPIESTVETVKNRFEEKTYIKRYRLAGEKNVGV
jgi:hypothetical protein